MLHLYHALVQAGLYHYILAWTVATVLTWLVAHRKYLQHKRTQERIADLLDTRTPGGLAELLKTIAQHEKDDSTSD